MIPPPVFAETALPALRLMSLAQMEAGGAWRLRLAHDRPEHLLIWMMRGQARVLADGAQRGLGAFGALLIPARTLMAIEPGFQAEAQVLLIPPDPGLGLPTRLQHLRGSDVAARAEITGFLEAIGREQRDQPRHFERAMDSYVRLIAIWLTRQIARADAPPAADDGLARAYCAHLVAHFANGARMGDHARILGTTPATLSRACQAATGFSATELRDQRVLHAARCLLADTAAPVAQIARHIGFSGAPTFARFVERQTGQSPTALRRPPR